MQIESRKKKLCLEPLRGIITQGEKMADAVTFRLPATYGALVLSDLSWQIRAASEKNTLVTADLTPSSGGEFCLVQWEVSADFTAVSGALSLMLVGTDSKGNVVIKFPGDDPIWIRDSETGEYTPPPDALEQAVIGIQQAQAALESAQESLEDAAQALQNTTANFRILGHYDNLSELQSAVTNPSMGDAYGVGDPTVVYTWNGSAWTQLPGVLVSPSLPMSVANGGTGATTSNDALKNLGAQASNNLLVNPRFKYNSRSQQSYNSSGSDVFTVDGWKVQIPASTSASFSLSPQGGVVLTTNGSNQGLRQDVYKENLPNGIYTISILVNGSIFSETFNFSGSIVSEYAGQNFSYAVISPSDDSYSVFPLIQYNTTQQSYTITAVKLELGSVSTLQAELDNPPPEDVEKLKLDMYDLDPGRCAYLPWHNENLLDNWYFVGGGSQQGGGQFPINQRGQTSYSGTGLYSIDRWKLSQGTTETVDIESNGISISASTVWVQMFENLENLGLQNGETVTLSAVIDGVLISGSTTYNASSSYISVVEANGFRLAISPQNKYFQLYNSSGTSENLIQAVKLELGYLSTLARKDESGNWVLTDAPPNFQQELAKCQRYFVRTNLQTNETVGPIIRASVWSRLFLSVPVPMRIGPTLTLSSPDLLFSVDTSSQIPAIQNQSFHDTTFVYGFTTGGASVGATYAYAKGIGYIDFSAEL